MGVKCPTGVSWAVGVLLVGFPKEESSLGAPPIAALLHGFCSENQTSAAALDTTAVCTRLVLVLVV